ncbi:MAG: 3-dehydroquinate synthase [Spirosomataceae bacterium]
MTILTQNFTVNYRYQVCFTERLFDLENPHLATFLQENRVNGHTQKLLFVLDEEVLNAHDYLYRGITDYMAALQDVQMVRELVVIPSGEAVKNEPVYLEKMLAVIHQHGIDRHSYVAAIGGGALLDMVGYACAISHRGVRHIRIPTTVLSQNDSGVGVKNSVNFYGKKNYLGTFSPPSAVFNDFTFLTTLGDRDWRSGVAEAVKVALIKDKAFFEWLEINAQAICARNSAVMQEQIIRCAQLHLNHIASGDPFERGSARPLDFGHWAAHKLEHLTNYTVKHGEAVAIGIALDTYYSHLLGWLSLADFERVYQVLKSLGFQLYHADLQVDTLISGLREFQEHLGGALTITLLQSLGKGVEVHEMNETFIEKAVQFLAQLDTVHE